MSVLVCVLSSNPNILMMQPKALQREVGLDCVHSINPNILMMQPKALQTEVGYNPSL